MQNSRQLPENFDPWKAIAALKSIATAIDWFVTEGPGAEQPLPEDAERALHGLVHASRLFADQVHAWLQLADANGIELPGVAARDTEDEIPAGSARFRLN